MHGLVQGKSNPVPGLFLGSYRIRLMTSCRLARILAAFFESASKVMDAFLSNNVIENRHLVYAILSKSHPSIVPFSTATVEALLHKCLENGWDVCERKPLDALASAACSIPQISLIFLVMPYRAQLRFRQTKKRGDSLSNEAILDPSQNEVICDVVQTLLFYRLLYHLLLDPITSLYRATASTITQQARRLFEDTRRVIRVGMGVIMYNAISAMHFIPLCSTSPGPYAEIRTIRPCRLPKRRLSDFIPVV